MDSRLWFIDCHLILFTLCEKLIDKNTFQLIDQPTRGNSTLDLLLSSILEGVANVQLSDSDGVNLSSDHKALTFDLHTGYKLLSYVNAPFHCFEEVIIFNNASKCSVEWNNRSLLRSLRWCNM